MRLPDGGRKVWLFVPGTALAFAPVSEDLNSASISPSVIGGRLCEASASWRGKSLRPQAWSRQWKRGGFIRRLSGLIYLPSTLDRIVAEFISSLPETPAKTTLSQESRKALTESDSSLPKSFALPKSAGLELSSARTCRGTRTDSLKPSSRHWRDWATALRQEYSVRPELGTPCGASDCSSWPSPRTITGGAESAERKQELGRTASGGGDLQAATEEWMAPVVPDTSTKTVKYQQGGTPLSMQVNNWASPLAQNYKGSGEAIYRPDNGNLRDDMLHFQAEQLFRLPSSPDQQIAGGSMSSTDSPNSNQPSVKRRLNPIFVEALMRWPTGLSGFARPETAWTRWQQRQLSFLSDLFSGSEPEQQLDMFS